MDVLLLFYKGYFRARSKGSFGADTRLFEDENEPSFKFPYCSPEAKLEWKTLFPC